MRWTIAVTMLLVTLGISVATTMPGVTAQDQPDPAPTKADPAVQAAHVSMLVANVASPDPRVRYAIREGLIPMGTIAVAALNGAKREHKDKRVRDFISRTVKVIKAKRKQGQRGRRGGRGGGTFGGGGRDRQRGGGFFNRSNEVDIDKVAMDANLTWDQMDQVLPILRAVRKESSALMSELMEAEGWAAFRDEEIRNDLNAALVEAAQEAEAKLAKVLKPEQMRHVKGHVSPMSDMMKRWQDRMNRRGNRNRGDRRGSERRGNERRGGNERRPR